MKYKYFKGIDLNMKDKSALKSEYRKLRGARGFVSKLLSFLATPIVNLVYGVGCIAFAALIFFPIGKLISIFASNSYRLRMGFTDSRLKSLVLLMFYPLILPVIAIVLTFLMVITLPDTFRGLSAGIDFGFSSIKNFFSGLTAKKPSADLSKDSDTEFDHDRKREAGTTTILSSTFGAPSQQNDSSYTKPVESTAPKIQKESTEVEFATFNYDSKGEQASPGFSQK